MLASASDCLAAGAADKRSFRYSSGSSDIELPTAAAALAATSSAATSQQRNSNGTAAAAAAAAELHQAEKLVDAAAHQQRSAFQFDTLTPVRTWYTPPAAPAGAVDLTANESAAAQQRHSRELDSIADMDNADQADDDADAENIAQQQHQPRVIVDEVASESSDNGGFVTEPSSTSSSSSPFSTSTSTSSSGTSAAADAAAAAARCARRAKRATVVGNPMFEAAGDEAAAAVAAMANGDGGDGTPGSAGLDDVPAESLGLDDLDMDYEQIMHYFDNLKVREREII